MAPDKFQVGVIGLGKFGLRFAMHLAELGHDVLGLDNNPDHIKQAQDQLTQVFLADGREKAVLEQVGLAEFEYVAVSIGDSISASAMITMFLKELNVPNVWVKASNSDHRKLLKKVGADLIVIPEDLAARQLADRLTHPGFVDYLPFDHNLVIHELTIDQCAGKTLRQLDLTNRYKIQVIAVRPEAGGQPSFIPNPDMVLSAGDILVVIGHRGPLEHFES
ncbi:MAG: TrkA family potassium uptake protein [Deltaproteobacteria bacterium]|nr:TrkA family potassium uptake protein [Candidatus Tharpella aukensis]